MTTSNLRIPSLVPLEVPKATALQGEQGKVFIHIDTKENLCNNNENVLLHVNHNQEEMKMANALNLAARAVATLHGCRYEFRLPERTQEAARELFLQAIATFMIDIRDFRLFEESEGIELFSFGVFGSLGSLFLESRGFVLRVFGEESVLDLGNTFLALVSPEYRLCSIADLICRVIPAALKERLEVKLAAEEIVSSALLPLMM